MPNLKKNLRETIEDNPDKVMYFFDESRFGTHSKIGHGWFKKGVRSSIKVKLGFQNFYVYSAVDIMSGKDFSLIVPKVNTPLMNVFLEEMSKDLGSKEAIVVMDCAGWHKSRALIVPWNIQIMYLPPYSPELNPVEKLWQYLKSNTIKNRIYSTLDELEDAVCEFIRGFDTEAIRRTCSINHCLY